MKAFVLIICVSLVTLIGNGCFLGTEPEGCIGFPEVDDDSPGTVFFFATETGPDFELEVVWGGIPYSLPWQVSIDPWKRYNYRVKETVEFHDTTNGGVYQTTFTSPDTFTVWVFAGSDTEVPINRLSQQPNNQTQKPAFAGFFLFNLIVC